MHLHTHTHTHTHTRTHTHTHTHNTHKNIHAHNTKFAVSNEVPFTTLNIKEQNIRKETQLKREQRKQQHTDTLAHAEWRALMVG
jgi:hypothetical protein